MRNKNSSEIKSIQTYPCADLSVRNFLNHVYMVEDMRHDYLHRQYEQLCKVALKPWTSNQENEPTKYGLSQSGSREDLPVPSKGSSLKYFSESNTCPNGLGRDQGEQPTQEEQIQSMEEKTTTIFASQPQIILPQDKKGNSITPRVITEGDESYLHLILPANEFNIINPQNVGDFEGMGEATAADGTYVEIGCKIFEVNRVQYQQ